MIGVSESTQRLNAKVESGVRQSAYDMNFVGSWTFDTNGATGDGTNTYWYIDYNYNVSETTMTDTHFGTYQTVAGSTAAYDILVAQAGGGTEFVVMTADHDSTGNGIYDYDVNSGTLITYPCTEPISNMMSYENPSDSGKNYVFQNDIQQVKFTDSANIEKDTWIYGGYDMTNGYYTNRGFGFITFGRVLEASQMTDYQKLINRFETSMSRNTY